MIAPGLGSIGHRAQIGAVQPAAMPVHAGLHVGWQHQQMPPSTCCAKLASRPCKELLPAARCMLESLCELLVEGSCAVKAALCQAGLRYFIAAQASAPRSLLLP